MNKTVVSAVCGRPLARGATHGNKKGNRTWVHIYRRREELFDGTHEAPEAEAEEEGEDAKDDEQRSPLGVTRVQQIVRKDHVQHKIDQVQHDDGDRLGEGGLSVQA